MPENLSESNTAGHLANRAVPTCNATDTAEAVLTLIKELSNTFEAIDYIYILNEQTLIGVISIHELLTASPQALVSSFMTTEVAYVHVQTDQEQVAQLALAQSIKAVPVIDDNLKFVGVISADVILRILSDEHTDDIYKSAGIKLSVADAYDQLSWFRHVSSRIPWLLLGLIGGVGAAVIIGLFEETISSQLALAAFIPAVVYIADAVGNQTEMLFIRALSRNSELSIWTYLLREWGVGAAIGILLGIVIFGVSYIWLQVLSVSIILALAIVATVYFSITVAVLLPWLFQKLNFDPAVASGPLATVVCDISSVCIYLLIASAIL